MMKLTAKVLHFVDEYLIDGNASRAYRTAYDCSKQSARSVGVNASRLLQDTDVAATVADRRAKISGKRFRKLQDIHDELELIANSDINDVVQVRRLNCRYCNGVNHAYQWRDSLEFDQAVSQHKARMAASDQRGRPKKGQEPAPSRVGGYGYRFNMPPHPNCPTCAGEGTADVFIADTTMLTRDKRKLIESIEQTQHGIKIKFQSRRDALVNMAKMMGGFKKTIVFQNPDGTPLAAPGVPTMPADQQDAARVYAEFLKGETDDATEDD